MWTPAAGASSRGSTAVPSTSSRGSGGATTVVPVRSPSTISIALAFQVYHQRCCHVWLRHHVYVVVWAVSLLLHLVCMTLSTLWLYGPQSHDLLMILRSQTSALTDSDDVTMVHALVYAVLLVIHGFLVLSMLLQSIYYRRLILIGALPCLQQQRLKRTRSHGQRPTIVTKCLQFWLGRRAVWHPEAPVFGQFVILQKAASVMLQTYQCYRLRALMDSNSTMLVVIQSVWLTLLVLNCWFMVLFTVLERRFVRSAAAMHCISLAIDWSLSALALFLVPTVVILVFYGSYRPASHDFEPTRWYNLTFRARVTMAAEFLLTKAWHQTVYRALLMLGFVTTSLSVGSLIGNRKDRDQLTRIVTNKTKQPDETTIVPDGHHWTSSFKSDASSLKSVHPDPHTLNLLTVAKTVDPVAAKDQTKTIKLRGLAQVVFALWGLVLIVVQYDATAKPTTITSDQCGLVVRKWLETSPACVSWILDCTKTPGLDLGSRNLDDFSSMRYLSVRNCPGFEINQIAMMPSLYGLEMRNSTLVMKENASVTGFQYSNLRFLYATESNLSALWPTEAFPPALTTLYVCHGHVNMQNAAWLHRLKHIALDFAALTTFPIDLLHASTVQTLSLVGNQLHDVPPIDAMNQLTQLVLNDNPLTAFHGDKLPASLQTLTMAHTSLTHLPEWFMTACSSRDCTVMQSPYCDQEHHQTSSLCRTPANQVSDCLQWFAPS